MRERPIAAIRERLLEGMYEYMEPDPEEELDDEDWDCGYTRRDVERCAAIIDGYLARIETVDATQQDRLREIVRETVVALNTLNDDCRCALIETDQREDLCALILTAARDAGLDTEADVTEEWRAW